MRRRGKHIQKGDSRAPLVREEKMGHACKWMRPPRWLRWYRIGLQCGRPGSVPGLGRCPGEGNGYPLQDSGLENSMDCRVHGVTKRGWATCSFTFFSCISVYSVTFFIVVINLCLYTGLLRFCGVFLFFFFFFLLPFFSFLFFIILIF